MEFYFSSFFQLIRLTTTLRVSSFSSSFLSAIIRDTEGSISHLLLPSIFLGETTFYQVVLDQRVVTSLHSHLQAFEYFGGVPQTIKLDNLEAGVWVPSFYELFLQHQYAELFDHDQAAPITARIARGQDKGKVESGIKYVKNDLAAAAF